MAAKLHYLNVLEVESVKKEDVSRALVIDKDEYVKALDIEQITTYQGLSNKPKINGVELDGDISLDELNVASKNDLNKVISDLEDIASDIPTSENIQDKIDDSLKNYATKDEVNNKQDKLVSGDNIKTINGYSLLGSGNIAIGGGGSTDLSNYYTKTESDNKFQLKGDYITPDNIDSYLGTINQDITELETSKQEAFQVNQPLVFSRSGEDLVLDVNLDNYVTDTELDDKQDKLISGTNIKTINGNSILGSGNIEISGTGDTTTVLIIDESTSTLIRGTYEDGYNALTNNQPILIYVSYKPALGPSSLIPADTIKLVNGTITAYFHTEYDTPTSALSPHTHIINVWNITSSSLTSESYTHSFVTDTELNTKQDKLTPGDNINITNNVISWEAPNVQFVNNIFTDDASLKYTVSDFNGTSTEKTFPVATQTSAGLMSVADKTKLDNLNGSGGGGESLPYLKVGLTSIVSGDFDAVYNAIINNEPYFLQVTWSGGELYGYYVIPETIWASNNTIYCYSQEHKVNGTFSLHTWTITADSVTITTDNDNAIPFMQINNNEIVSGTFDEVYRAVKYNHPYFIKLYITGTLDYWGDPEMTRINGDNLECWSTYHPIDGSYTQVMWTITPDGTVTKNEWELNLVSTESYSTSTSAVEKIVTLTQDEYDSLSEYDSSILYLIV